MQQLENVLKDYFDLSDRMKEMHTEILSLREQLTEVAALQCIHKECIQRKTEETQQTEAAKNTEKGRKAQRE